MLTDKKIKTALRKAEKAEDLIIDVMRELEIDTDSDSYTDNLIWGARLDLSSFISELRELKEKGK